MFLFDESPQTLLSRCGGLDVNLASHVDAGRIAVQQIDPVELTPGEFINRIRVAVEERDAKIIVIDSLNGYLNAMPEERFLTIQLHELLMYLGQRSVATILIGAHQGLIGSQMNTPVDASYLADAVILHALFRSQGRSPPGHFGDEETRQQARTHHSRVPPRRRPDQRRRGVDVISAAS